MYLVLVTGTEIRLGEFHSARNATVAIRPRKLPRGLPGYPVAFFSLLRLNVYVAWNTDPEVGEFQVQLSDRDLFRRQAWDHERDRERER